MSLRRIDYTDPASVRKILANVEWGVVTSGAVVLHICPSCMAIIPSAFTSPSVSSPRDRHIEYHVGISQMIADIRADMQ